MSAIQVRVFKPHRLLEPYIECFYIMKKETGTEQVRYLTFPSINSIVSVNRDAEFRFGKNTVTVHSKPGRAISSSLICRYNKPIEIILPGGVDEITIYFKPLGINAFLTGDLVQYTGEYFTDFNPHEDFYPRMTELMQASQDEERIRLMEAYWLSKLQPFEHPFLAPLIEEMLGNDRTYSIEELAARYRISRKTLCKHFELHMGKTPREFRKIARFRKALQHQLQHTPRHKLSGITYALDFFDQSHLIKDFRSITGMSPKQFFRQVTPHENGQINWLYV